MAGKVERLIDPEPGALYPRLIEASGRCPPEDIGGPWGYAELLEAMGDSKHEHHDEFKECIADNSYSHPIASGFSATSKAPVDVPIPAGAGTQADNSDGTRNG